MANSKTIIFNQEDTIPAGLQDAQFEDIEDSIDGIEENETDEDFENADNDDSVIIDASDINELSAPTDITIIGQTVRILPGGASVVDVEIEVANQVGVVNYEIRTGKVA